MNRFGRYVIAVASTMFLLLSVGRETEAATRYDTPTNSEFKAYMDYRAITSKNSKQWKLQQQATTDENGLRVLDGRYLVAIGSGFNAPVGTYIDVYLVNGNILNCIVGEWKQDRHTDAKNMQAPNGNIVEFIVDKSALESHVRTGGTISKIDGFESGVKYIVVFDEDEDIPEVTTLPIDTVTEISTESVDLVQISLVSETDVSNIFVEPEVYESIEEETFVTYNPEDEVVFIY